MTWKATATLLTVGALALIFTTGAKPPPPPPPSPDTPLCATFRDWPGDAIQSDDGALADGISSVYFNGMDGVTAVITGDQGRLQFDTGVSLIRRAYVNLGPQGPDPAGYYRIHFITGAAVQGGSNNLNLNNLPIGTSTLVGMLVFVRGTAEGDWMVGFGDFPKRTKVNHWPCDDAAPAIVTRVDATTWTLEADATSDHCLYWGGANNAVGRIACPFKMTFTLR